MLLSLSMKGILRRKSTFFLCPKPTDFTRSEVEGMMEDKCPLCTKEVLRKNSLVRVEFGRNFSTFMIIGMIELILVLFRDS